MRVALLAGLLLFLLGAAPLVAQAQATETPTPTQTLAPSATPNNSERIVLATVPPPRTCGTVFVPCGPLPFVVPRFPTIALPSPTLAVTATEIVITSTPTPTNTPTVTGTPPTSTPTFTHTPIIDVDPVRTLSGGLENVAGTLSARPTGIVISGTAISIVQAVDVLGAQMGAPFSILTGVFNAASGLGFIGTIIRFLFFSTAFVVLVYVTTVTLPFILGLFRFLLQVWDAITPF